MTIGLLFLRLSPEDVEKLRRPIVGRGGFQGLMRDIQKEWRSSSCVIVLQNPKTIERFLRYRSRYGTGGFQSRLGRFTKGDGATTGKSA